MGSLRVGHNWATSLSLFTFMHWRRKWQPTPVFLPGESQGRGHLVGCYLWGRTESDVTEATWQQQQQPNSWLLFAVFSYLLTSCSFSDCTVVESCQCRRHRSYRFGPRVRKMPWRRKWQPTPVCLPGEFYGQRSLAGYSPWGRKEMDMTLQLSTHMNKYHKSNFYL